MIIRESVNAFMGNLDSEDYSPEVEERLDELEAEMGSESEEWADRYEDFP